MFALGACDGFILEYIFKAISSWNQIERAKHTFQTILKIENVDFSI